MQVPKRLGERVWGTKFQSTLRNIYFRLRGFNFSLLLLFFCCGPKAGSHAGEERPWQKPISTNFKIGVPQLRSVTEIAPKRSFLCLSRNSIWYGFRVCSRVIRYCVKIALDFITKSLTFTKRAVHVTFKGPGSRLSACSFVKMMFFCRDMVHRLCKQYVHVIMLSRNQSASSPDSHLHLINLNIYK